MFGIVSAILRLAVQNVVRICSHEASVRIDEYLMTSCTFPFLSSSDWTNFNA